MRQTLSLFAAALVAAACGLGGAEDDSGSGAPGTSGTNTGVGCAESDLIAQCPPGSNPDLSAAATSACQGSADFLLSGDGGSVHAACRGTGECLVVCNFVSPCPCGVTAITTAGIECTPCAQASACGNAICEGGEDPNSCPVDCAAACGPMTRRCNGRAREDCNDQGKWEVVACRDDQACGLGPAGVACVPDLNPAGGTFEDTGYSDEPLEADPADIYFPEAELRCADPMPGQPAFPCQPAPLAYLEDGRVLGVVGVGLVLLTTTAAPEALPVTAHGTRPGVDFPWVATADRQPELYNLETRQKRLGEAVVDDVTELAWGPAAVHAATGRAAVAFSAAGQPFVAVYALDTGRIEAMLRYAEPALTTAATGLDFSPNGELLAELRGEGLAIVWNVEEKKHARLIRMEGDNSGRPVGAMDVAFTRGLGPHLVMTTGGGFEMWDLKKIERVWKDGPERDPIFGPFTLSGDGRIIAAAGSHYGGLGLYYLQSLEFIRALNALPTNVGVTTVAAAFSPDGRRLAYGAFIYASYPE